MIRTIAAWTVLFIGLALSFAIFFGVIVAAAIFLGIGWAAAAFAVQIAGVTAGISALFAGERISEEDGWGEVCAPEGATYWLGSNGAMHVIEGGNVTPLPLKGRVS